MFGIITSIVGLLIFGFAIILLFVCPPFAAMVIFGIPALWHYYHPRKEKISEL